MDELCYRKENDSENNPFIESKNKVSNDGLGSRWKVWRRRRFTVVTMVVFGEICKSILRSNFNIAVFPMTEISTVTIENGTKIQLQDFDWDAKTRGVLLSVFFYGYISTNLLGGILAVKYGGGKLYGLGIFLTSITTLFTPAAAHVHFYLLVAVRVIEGMCEGILTSCMEMLLSCWIPADERSMTIAVIMTGASFGQVVGIAASSAIGYQYGWQAIFYCAGGVGVAWFIIWETFVKGEPSLDNKIIMSELIYIRDTSGRIGQQNKKILSIPYVGIFTSVPVWAYLTAHFAGAWSFTTFMTHSPAYIKDVLNLDYQTSSYLSSVPFAVNVVASNFSSILADFLTRKKILTPTTVRKIHVCGGLAIMAVTSFLIRWVTTAPLLVTCLSFILMFNMVGRVQIMVNILELAPRYASVLAGMMTTISTICGMITPIVTGHLTQNKTAEEWHTVFYIQCGLCLVGALIYGVLASGQLQPWAADSSQTSKKEDRNVAPI